MKEWYWKVVGAVGLVVAAAYVFGVCRPFTPTPVGAQSAELIAVAPSNQNSYALYVIDVPKRVLLVYSTSARGSLTSFGLMYGRHMEADLVVAQKGRELRFRQKPYSVPEMVRHLRGLGP